MADGLRFTWDCMLHALAGCGMGVVLDSACDRIFKKLTKNSLHIQLARIAMIVFQLLLFVLIAAMEVVYSHNSESEGNGTPTIFFEMMLFGAQFGFFQRIEDLTKDV